MRARAGTRGVALVDLLFAGGAAALLVVLLLARGGAVDREAGEAERAVTVGSEGGPARPR